MKKLIVFSISLLLTISVSAQTPQKMSYQCVVRNSSGALITNQAVGIRISILQGSAIGNVVFSETYNPNPQTNANGLLTVEIGGGLEITGTFATIDWSVGPYFLKTDTDPTCGTNYTIVGTSQLLSVPYALFAKSSADGFSGNYNDLTNLPTLFSGNYNDLINKPNLFDGTWASLTGIPTTLSGYGINDAMGTSHPANNITSANISNWTTSFGWGNHSGLYRPITYVPAWNEISSKPTTVSGYGITDAVTTAGDQAISGNKTFTDTISASSNRIINVANPINDQDAATKAYVDNLLKLLGLIDENFTGILTDVDGNMYKTVQIGDQLWMAENLKTTKYNDGLAIDFPNTDNQWWANNTTGAYAWNENDISYKNIYGALYNWHAVMTGKLCPDGWHVPSDAEWQELEMFLGMSAYDADRLGIRGDNNEGGKLKEEGYEHWYAPNTGATNETGFTGLPGNLRYYNGEFLPLLYTEEQSGFWWSTSIEPVSGLAIQRRLNPNHGSIWKYRHSFQMGYSVRCLKD